jgi:hypothetical protein
MKLHANAVEAAPRRHRDRSSNQARSEDTGYRRGCLGHGAAKESNLPSVGLPRPAGFEDQMGSDLLIHAQARAVARSRYAASMPAASRSFPGMRCP